MFKRVGSEELVLGLPERTEIRKPISKEIIYKTFPEMKGEKRKNFDEDISRIIITNELSERTLNFSKGEKISTIFVIQLLLKKKEYSKKNIDIIFRLFNQSIVLVLCFEGMEKVIVNYSRNIETDWFNEGEFGLALRGSNFDDLFESFVKQIGNITVYEGNNLEEQIRVNDERQKLLKEIERLEKKAWKEKNPKKKFELAQEINRLRVRSK